MIYNVKVKYFKKFEDQEFELDDTIILAGPNNFGKTTLLQALAVWNLTVQRWLSARTKPAKSKAKIRTGIPVTRKDFTAIPLREMDLLWTNRSTAYREQEGASLGKKTGSHKLIEIIVSGKDPSSGKENNWELGMELRFQSTEQIYVKPVGLTESNQNVPSEIENLTIVHVPPFSGIGPEETRYDEGYRNMLIGQGKPGDILRNLLLDVSKTEHWDELANHIENLFQYRLLKPEYDPAGKTYIVCEYLPAIPKGKGTDGLPRLDIANAGSGFHQTLLLLAFFYGKPGSVLLLDEPDAHLHVILQREIYNLLRSIAHKRQCQLIVATHSEVLIDNTGPEKIVSFLRYPHRLVDKSERDQVREAIKRLSSLDILLADETGGVLYVEGESDFQILHEWAKVLNHPSQAYLKRPFVYPIKGRNPQEARAHFFALRALRKDRKGLLILDGDNRNLSEHEISADELEIFRWERYEIENYLLVPEAIKRFCRGPKPTIFDADIDSALAEFLPMPALKSPFGTNPTLMSVKASEEILVPLLSKAGNPKEKSDLFLLAGVMQADEIHPDVKFLLDKISQLFSTED